MLLTYTGTKPIILRRYMDDYFGISTSTKKELKDFMQYVNDFHPSLIYTYDISDTSVNFLDISISMTQHGLATDIFYIDTDIYSYLRYESAHPPSCKKGIPYSQFKGLRRICNNDHTFERRSDEMSEFFSQRGFPVNTIKNSLRRASKFTQSEAINKRRNLNNTGVPLTMKFSDITQCIAKTIKSNQSILPDNHKTNCIFGTNSVIVAFKREKNRRDCFIRSKLYRDDNTAKKYIYIYIYVHSGEVNLATVRCRSHYHIYYVSLGLMHYKLLNYMHISNNSFSVCICHLTDLTTMLVWWYCRCFVMLLLARCRRCLCVVLLCFRAISFSRRTSGLTGRNLESTSFGFKPETAHTNAISASSPLYRYLASYVVSHMQPLDGCGLLVINELIQW